LQVAKLINKKRVSNCDEYNYRLKICLLSLLLNKD
jgi:hypothetical protein